MYDNISVRTNSDIDMQSIVKYVVDTYSDADFPSLLASDVDNLFLSPFPRPMSNRLNQLTMEYIVSQIPYKDL